MAARVQPAARAGKDAPDQLLTQLYTAHYRGLVRLAAFLTGDRDSAEELVQDAYVKVHGRWLGIREPERAEAYLRRTVVNLARSHIRHRRVVEREPAPLPRAADSAETGALSRLQADSLMAALGRLAPRQREALILRYYTDLSEAQTAHAMDISTGAVKSHTSRGLAALRTLLEDW